jgi:hypothetical protein
MKIVRFLSLASLLMCARLPATRAGAQQTHVSANQFTLLHHRGGFVLHFVENGKSKEVVVPRDWLIPRQEEKNEESKYVTSFNYAKEVSAFSIGDRRVGLHLSSYNIQA